LASVEIPKGVTQSSVPFGCESSSDTTEEIMHAILSSVFSAFRL